MKINRSCDGSLRFSRKTTRLLHFSLLTFAGYLLSSGPQGWAAVDQLIPIAAYFDAGNDDFEIDAYPGINSSQKGWNGRWTNGVTAPGTLTASVVTDNPLGDPTNGNYLSVTIANTNISLATKRQYTTYTTTPTGVGDSTNAQTYSVTVIPHRVRFDVRVDSFTNTLTGATNWSSRSDNFFIHAANQQRTSPNTDSAWIIFVQGGASRVQDPSGPANRFLYYDGNPIRTDQGAGRYVDSGMDFQFGVVYHFEVITDARDKTYTVRVSDNTGTNATYTSGPLRWRSSGDVSVVTTRGFLHFGGTCSDVNSMLNFSVDSIVVENIPPSVFPPLITQLRPGIRAPLPVTFPPLSFKPELETPLAWQAGKGISFVASTGGGASNDYSGGVNGVMMSAGTTIAPNQIGLVLNGTDVSAGLSISGAPNFRKVVYNGLAPNIDYAGVISVTNSAGAVKQHRFYFDTFDESFVRYIEAEDYNYSDGTFPRTGSGTTPTVGGFSLENPLPSQYFTNNGTYVNQAEGYVDRIGLAEVDFSDTAVSNASPVVNAYRFGDPVGTSIAVDFPRQKYLDAGTRDFQVNFIQPNEWLNYTRTFPAGTYKIVLRASSTGTSNPNNQYVNLDRVTSDPTQPGQTTENLGTFLVPYTGNALAFTTVPLIETNGNTEITVALSGKQTLRLTALNANNNLQLNYLLLVPATSNAASVSISTPVNGANVSSGATVALSATAGPSGTITKVEYFNGTVSLGSSTTSPYNVDWTGVPTGRYTIVAKATTSAGFTSSSAPITVTAGSPARKVLFAIGSVGVPDPNNSGSGDQYLRDLMASKGWVSSDLFDTNINALGGFAASSGFDLVVMSASVQSANVNAQFRDVPIPVWNGEGSHFGNMGFTKDGGAADFGASGGNITFNLPAESVGLPGTAGLPAGLYQLAQGPGNANRASSVNQNAVKILTITNVGNATVFCFYYPAGAELFNGIIAPATRYVWYSATIDAHVSNPLTTVGTNLLMDGLDVAMANPVFTGQIVRLKAPGIAGGSVTIPFTGASADLATDFSLWSSATIDGTFTIDSSALITSTGTGQFEATTMVNGSARFYYIRKN